MSSKDRSKKTEESGTKKQGTNVVDMLLGKSRARTLDSATMIMETQKRVWAALKKGYEYTAVVDESEDFLRQNVLAKLDMVVLYVDLVGSTNMALEMPAEKIAIIVSSFSQEMASVIRQHHGYVLKFVGDAVIGYFVSGQSGLLANDYATNCAKSMISVIRDGINPVLDQYDYPELQAKIGVDFGQNIVVRYGSDPKHSHVDLMGPAMNIAAKIQGMAHPNQILIGNDVYERLHPTLQNQFERIVWRNDEWKYRSRLTGDIYQVYGFKPQ